MQSRTNTTSTDYTLHNTESAPSESRELLNDVQEEYGFTPNLMAVMAESPSTLRAYGRLSNAFDETSLTPAERQIVLLTTAVENRSAYCVPAHSATAEKTDLDRQWIERIRSREALSDDRAEALRSFVIDLTNARGSIDDARFKRFLEAGFSKRDALAVVSGVVLATFGNLVNHLVDAPVDEPYRQWAWSPVTEPAMATV